MQRANKGEIFETIQVSKPQSNIFDLGYGHKTTCNLGELVPIYVEECVPGDYFRIGGKCMVKFAPMVFPVMGFFYITIHYFFVPTRILWPNWETFITNGGDNPDDPLPAFPAIGMIGSEPYANSRLANWLGMPLAPSGPEFEDINVVPFAVYQKIYDDMYRDQNLIDPVFTPLLDGTNQANIAVLTQHRKRAYKRDYLTSGLPEAQRGSPVAVPIGAFEDVQVHVQKTAEGSGVTTFTATPSNIAVGRQDSTSPGILDGLFAETSNMQSGTITITELRTAEKLQEYLEKSMRAGNRYHEFNRAHFGVVSPDQRLQRAEYITGVVAPVVIGEVLSTADTGDQPVGGMAGHGLGVANGGYGSYFCAEHGYIMGIMSVLPQASYMNGVPKMFTKWKDPFQYYTPEFAHVGEQPIYSREVYGYQTDPDGDVIWAYTPRYSEYKFRNNMVTGEFQTTLKAFTPVRKFSTPPGFNAAFMEVNAADFVDIFAVTDGSDKLWCHIENSVSAVRRMPIFGEPKW